MAEPAHPAPRLDSRSRAWARAAAGVGIALVLVAGAVVVLKSCLHTPVVMLDHAGQALEKVAEAFNRGTLTTSFVSYATTVTNELRLQVARLDQMEFFTRKQEASTGFGYIPLPDVVVEARAPVQYTYYLDLQEKWRLVVANGAVQVVAPALKFNKPAVDASAIEYEVRKGFFKTSAALESLKHSITTLVELRARQNVPLVREIARHQTETFVVNWLTQRFTDGHQYPVQVVFADEPAAAAAKPVSVVPRE